MVLYCKYVSVCVLYDDVILYCVVLCCIVCDGASVRYVVCCWPVLYRLVWCYMYVECVV